MNEQRRDFFRNSALGLATITLSTGFSLHSFCSMRKKKPQMWRLLQLKIYLRLKQKLTLAPNVPKPIERNYPQKSW